MNECKELSSCDTVTPSVSTDFDVCLPFGGQLSYTGGYLTYSKGTPPPDGIYTSVTIKNGCIVAVGSPDIAVYTQAPFAVEPAGCSEMNTDIPIAPNENNLTRLDSTGAVLTTLSIRGEGSVTITGTGTENNPIVVTGADDSSGAETIVISGNSGIIVEGDGSSSNPYTVAHYVTADAPRHVNGMTFDRYGHLTDYVAPSTAGTINGVIAGDGIKVDTNVQSGIATVSQSDPTHNLRGQYSFGGLTVELDAKNRIYQIEQSISVEAGTYTLGNYKVTINSMGNITKIVPTTIQP